MIPLRVPLVCLPAQDDPAYPASTHHRPLSQATRKSTEVAVSPYHVNVCVFGKAAVRKISESQGRGPITSSSRLIIRLDRQGLVDQ